jgi:hypothetical protein
VSTVDAGTQTSNAKMLTRERCEKTAQTDMPHVHRLPSVPLHLTSDAHARTHTPHRNHRPTHASTCITCSHTTCIDARTDSRHCNTDKKIRGTGPRDDRNDGQQGMRNNGRGRRQGDEKGGEREGRDDTDLRKSNGNTPGHKTSQPEPDMSR